MNSLPYIALLFILLIAGCSKHVAVCMKMEDGGNANGTITAGPWGDVLELNVVGPGSLERIPEGMLFNPCKDHPPPGNVLQKENL